VLLTLLVIWVIVIPALTVIGTYLASGVPRRRTPPVASVAMLARVAERLEPSPDDSPRNSTQPHSVSRRTRGHALAGR
jgi:hypothetical protein